MQTPLQQAADQQRAISPHSGQPLQAAPYEIATLDTCARAVAVRAYYGPHPKTGQWQHPIRLLSGLQPRQRLRPQMQERLSYTAAETDS